MTRSDVVTSQGQKKPWIKSIGAVTATIICLLLGVSAAAQTSTGTAGSVAGRNWKVPRTADGKPDFQGIWSNNSITPLERPTQWAGKESLSDAEVAELKQLLAQVDVGGDALFGDQVIQAALDRKQKSYDPTTGNYNQFWIEDRDFDNRTSRIIDPPDGRIPPLTPEAQQRRKAQPSGINYKADGPEDRSLSERCITYGVPRTGAGYDSYFQIVQSRDTVAIMQELIHDIRIIPIGAEPHISQTVRQWHGDSRGHWEGDTLVVETTNYRQDTNLNGATQNLRVIERFTRTSEDYLNWEVTYIDSATWTKPWTEMVRLKRSDKQVYEYACHEGNYAMTDILAGARSLEETSRQNATPKESK